MKYFLLLTLLLSAGCLSEPSGSARIAIVRGEPLNVRKDLDEPAPNEESIEEEAYAEDKRPYLQTLSRKRALELFRQEKIDWVVPGHAASFPEEFSQHRSEKGKTRAVFIQLKNSMIHIRSAEDLFRKKTSVAIIRNSAFEKHFVKKVGQMSLVILNDFSDVLSMLKKQQVSGVIIDKAAVDYAGEFIPNARITDLGLPEETIYYLKR